MLDIRLSIKKGTLPKDVRAYVAEHSRQENILLYYKLIDVAQHEPDGAAIEDVLDAMSGWCHPDCWIGTGDYHL